MSMNESVTELMMILLHTLRCSTKNSSFPTPHLLLCKNWWGNSGGTNSGASASSPLCPVFPFSVNGANECCVLHEKSQASILLKMDLKSVLGTAATTTTTTTNSVDNQ